MRRKRRVWFLNKFPIYYLERPRDWHKKFIAQKTPKEENFAKLQGLSQIVYLTAFSALTGFKQSGSNKKNIHVNDKLGNLHYLSEFRDRDWNYWFRDSGSGFWIEFAIRDRGSGQSLDNSGFCLKIRDSGFSLGNSGFGLEFAKFGIRKLKQIISGLRWDRYPKCRPLPITL